MERKWSKHQIYFINELNELTVSSLVLRRDANLKADINDRNTQETLDEELEVILYIMRNKRQRKILSHKITSPQK